MVYNHLKIHLHKKYNIMMKRFNLYMYHLLKCTVGSTNQRWALPLWNVLVRNVSDWINVIHSYSLVNYWTYRFFTILNKRAAYRKAYDNFDIDKVARYGADKIERLLQNPELVRHEKKVEAGKQIAYCHRSVSSYHNDCEFNYSISTEVFLHITQCFLIA